MAMVNPMVNLVNVKDSRWLTLEVCREFQRNKCTRTELECKFAHPPPHVEVQNGRVTCCFDSIKGKCQRKDPPCKYLHPPQHLKEQLLQNGRNNLILKNLQMQALAAGALQPLVPGMVPVSEATSHHAPYPRLAQNMPGFQQYGLTMYDPASASNKALSYPTHTVLPSQYQILQANPYLGVPNPALNPYLMPSVVTGAVPGAIAPVETGTPVSGAATAVTPVSVVPSPGVGAATATTQKITRPDRLESTNSSNGGEPAWTYADSIAQSSQYSHLYFQVCREYQRGTCSRQPSECRFAHPYENVTVDSNDNHVTVCMDYVKGKCTRDNCRYFHPPPHLQVQIKAAQQRANAASAQATQVLVCIRSPPLRSLCGLTGAAT